MTLGTIDDLIARLHASISMASEARPIAILAGSGITAGAVPSVNEIINAIRNAMTPDDAAQIDVRLAKLSEPGLKYQEAFTFLSLRRPPEYRDRIIRACTLRAYNGSIQSRADLGSDKLPEYERDVDGWKIPVGLQALGRIWSGLPPAIRGPILTTNFDPLCEAAIQKAGSQVVPRIVDADGAFLRDVKTVTLPQVVHLHGYWRDSATLSMTTQLTQDRPALEGSIRALLNQYTLVVLGYGAWRDALTTQMIRVIKEQQARELDVLWCYYGGSDELMKQASANQILSALLQAPGNIQFYTSVDVNKALPLLERKLADFLHFSDTPRERPGQGTLISWMPVTRAVTDLGQDTADRNAALTFFDGRLPNWQDAVNPLLPRRDIVRTVQNELTDLLRRRQSSLTLVTGASGEGKTTALMQVAASLARVSSPVTILFNPQGRIASVDEILTLPGSDDYLLVLDEAFRSIERLKELVTRINESGRTGLHLLLGSRDTDWSNVGGFTFAWNRYCPTKQHRLRGINRPDAAALIQSWERLGPEALGSLASLRTTEDRVSALMDAAAEQRLPEEGAFLGALLETRYGPGLIDHIRELLIRLSQHHIYAWHSEVDASLLDALFLIALPHASHVRTMNLKILARALDIAEQELFGAVVLPLGDEAAVAFDGERILVRHSLIAQAVCDLGGEFNIDLSEVAIRIVNAAISAIERYGPSPDLLELAYLSQHLKDPERALKAAKAAVDAGPRRLSYRTSLSRALRVAGRPEEASRTAEEGLALIVDADDALSGVRPMLTEWGVTEGSLGRVARNVVLIGLALQDMDAWSYIPDQAAAGAVCMSIALRKMYESFRMHVFLDALSCVVEIGHHLDLAPSQRRVIRESADAAFRYGGSAPDSLTSAAANLAVGCRAALERIEKPFPPNLPPRRFRFDELVRIANW